jgi:hypothetical protein
MKKSYSADMIYKIVYKNLKLDFFMQDKPYVIINPWCFDESDNEFVCPSPPKKSKTKKSTNV